MSFWRGELQRVLAWIKRFEFGDDPVTLGPGGISTTGPITAGSLTAASTDAGAAAGPTLTLYRNSASPAASDVIGQVLFQGEDSAGNTESYAGITTTITDPTSGSEDATLALFAKIAGTSTTHVTVGASLVTLGSNIAIAFAGTGAATTRTNLGVAIGSNVQAWDADLDALAASSGTGISVRTGSATWAVRTLGGTANEIDLANGNGVAGNPTISLSATIGAAKAFRRGNILGTVTESAGVPTGALIERISNANGEAVRFADGTLICWINAFLTSDAGTVGWSFPSTFSVAPAVAATANVTALAVRIAMAGSVTTTGAQIQIVDATPARIASSAHLIATGRWF